MELSWDWLSRYLTRRSMPCSGAGEEARMAADRRTTTKGGGDPGEKSGSRSAEYLSAGRVNQKLRTRDSLVTVAADMVMRGVPLTVPEVADAARVSRTTAYRYFPTSEMLEAQASLHAAGLLETRHIDEIAHGSGGAEDKLISVIEASDAMTLAHENSYRTMLRFSVAGGMEQYNEHFGRPAFRRKWMEASLAEHHQTLGRKNFNRLTAALSLLCGIEAVVVLQDICHLSADEALDVKKWAAKLLWQGAHGQSETSPRRKDLEGDGISPATLTAKGVKKPSRQTLSPAAGSSATGSPPSRKARPA